MHVIYVDYFVIAIYIYMVTVGCEHVTYALCVDWISYELKIREHIVGMCIIYLIFVFVIVFVHLFVHRNVNSICNVRLYLLIENLVLQRM